MSVSNLIRKPYVRIALSYAVFGLLWIILTDRILLTLVPTLEKLVIWQTYKGWFFVTASTLLIYVLLTASNRQQQRTQDVLVKSEKTYRLLFENNPLPMWVYDLETLAFLAVNEAAVDKYGFSRDEFLAMSIRDIRPPEDVPRLLADVAQTTRRLNFAGEWHHRRKDGTVFPVEITSHELVYNGRSARLVIANDLTERKQVENALKESEARFRTAIEEAPFPIMIHAEGGEILAISRTWSEITGYQPDEIPTLSDWIERAYGDRWKHVQAIIERLYKMDRRVAEGEFQIRCKDGSYRTWDFSSTPLGPLPDGRRIVISMAADVTERKALWEQVKAQAEQLSQVMRTVPEGVLLLNQSDEILLANPQGQEYLASLAKVKTDNQITHLGDTPLETLQTSPLMGQWHEVRENGRVFQVITHPVETGPVPQGWVLVLRDVTEQQEVPKQLQQQERLAAIGQVAAGIAHDFNNILAVIVLYAQILERTPELSAKQQQQLNTIAWQAQQGAELIQQILDFSRRSVLAKQQFGLLALLQKEISLLQRTLPEHIEIKLISEPGDYLLQADPTRLQQTIMNLSINARDAMPHGGQLRFDTGKNPGEKCQTRPLSGHDGR